MLRNLFDLYEIGARIVAIYLRTHRWREWRTGCCMAA
jgi:hypothetical protein